MSQMATSEMAKTVVLGLLDGYKRALSPLLPPACRYVPTCSDYAIEAVARYGVFRGCGMGIGRLLRCHPFAQSGYDPVVESTDHVVAHGAIPPAADH
jgi:putative membrane protein insertion efficiency factor